MWLGEKAEKSRTRTYGPSVCYPTRQGGRKLRPLEKMGAKKRKAVTQLSHRFKTCT